MSKGGFMELTTNSPESVAHAFLRAINRQSVDELIALMSPGHRFIDSLGVVVEGREKLREGWTAYFRMVPDYAVAIEETYPSERAVVLLGVAQGTFTRDGALRSENRWQTPVAVRALIDDGLVTEWRVYADNQPIRRVMANTR
jgi:ketosteroid isomerase-like protein